MLPYMCCGMTPGKGWPLQHVSDIYLYRCDRASAGASPIWLLGSKCKTAQATKLLKAAWRLKHRLAVHLVLLAKSFLATLLASAAMASALDVAKRLDFQDVSEVLPQALSHDIILRMLAQPNTASFRRCVHPLACLRLPVTVCIAAPHF